jgi:hypothetical protein
MSGRELTADLERFHATYTHVRGTMPARVHGATRLLVACLLTLAACGGDDGGPPPPAAATVAYIVTSCRQTGAEATLQQEVRIVHGEAQAVTVMSVGPLGPFPSVGTCALRGSIRARFYLQSGPVQRFGITPDGSAIVFELTDEFVLEGRALLPPEQRGIFYMRADGSGLRRLGPASRSPSVSYSPGGFSWDDFPFGFDPSGREFTYTDRGPDEAGQEAAQVFVQELTPGAPSRQVTRLPALHFPGQFPEISAGLFIDAKTINFARWIQPGTEYEVLLVDVDGTPPREVRRVALPGGQVIPVFSIIGADWLAFPVRLPGEPVHPYADQAIAEVFVTDGTNVLQLTSFHRADTTSFPPFYSARDQRVYFTASADPFGTNPSENCQIFSIEPFGRDLRQLTFFRESAAHAANGCFGGRRPNGCRIDFNGFNPSQNPHTGTIFFRSTCDPFGDNPNGGQLFAMQPDGSDLRQLTNARGFVRGANNTFEVETVDDFWSAPY